MKSQTIDKASFYDVENDRNVISLSCGHIIIMYGKMILPEQLECTRCTTEKPHTKADQKAKESSSE